jgi:hypothetical protein
MKTHARALAALLVALSIPVAASAQAPVPTTGRPLIHRLLNLPPSGLDHSRSRPPGTPVLLGDRYEYGNDDGAGQFYLILPAPSATNSATATNTPAADAEDDAPAGEASTNTAPLADELSIALAIMTGKNSNLTVVAQSTLPKPLFEKTHFLIDATPLAPGKYRVSACLRSATHAPITVPVTWEFTRTDRTRKPVAFPAEGIPIELEGQTLCPNEIRAYRVAVPLPRHTVTQTGRLVLEENGTPIPAQITPAASWGPSGALRLVHVKFMGRTAAGRPAAYRLRLAPPGTPTPSGTGAVKVTTGAKDIVVDNGTVRFVVNRQRFNGIAQAWYDPSGQGRYDTNAPVIVPGRPEAGPYLVDGRLIRFDASADKAVKVEVEEIGPVTVTIAATGWYTDSQKRPRAAPLCQFKTRITCHANQPAIEVSHHTIITYDTRNGVLADVGFHIPVAEAVNFRLGADGKPQAGVLPAIPAGLAPNRDGFTSIPGVFLHQDRSDHFRLIQPGQPPIEGRRSDGWASLQLAGSPAAVSVTLKDVWQKFPKELGLSRRGLTLHFWPEHGQRAFAQADELSLRNIYKFWCFHQNSLLNLNLPSDYFDALTAEAEETRECRPAHALNGNGQGLAMGSDFEIRFAAATLDPAPHAALFQQSPAARTPPEWNALTEALGPIAATNVLFDAMETAILKGTMSYNASVERGQDYGMWIWPDTHTYWFPAEQRASLHRVWQNSHYHQAGNAWMMWYRGAPFEWLRWARASSDHYRNVSTINYAELDENGRSRIKFHYPGAMYHCKGCTPWGSESDGMARRDTHAGLYGHWTDPDTHLWCWYLDANPRARDLYTLWIESVKRRGLLDKGTAREANNTLAVACSAYEATWDADFLPIIHGLGKSLPSKPLETQNPGPLWHPLWVNRYYHLTRDPAYIPFILKYGRFEWMGNTWNLGMAALAYELTGDTSYLTAHVPRLVSFPRSLYRQPGDPYDNYGFGPGPMGFGWVEMTWGPFLKSMQDAGITKLDPPETALAAGAITPVHYQRRSIAAVAYALKQADKPWTLSFSGAGVEGDMNRCTFTVTAPDGAVIHKRDMPQANSTRWKLDVPADGQTGLYRLQLTGYGVFNMTASTLDAHASLLTTNASYLFPRCRAYLMPAGKPAPVELSLGAVAKLGDRLIVDAIVRDATGREVCQASLCALFSNKKTTVRLDPAVNPLPWLIDIQGAVGLTIASQQGQWLLAPTVHDLELMKGPLGKQAP